MILDTYDAARLATAFGIDMSDIAGIGVGAGWGRVAPGVSSDPHQHDETETFVIVRGTGDLIVDGRRYPARPGVVVQFEPFETHVIENTGDEDLLFVTLYWRDPERAGRQAAQVERGRLRDRPVFVFSTPPTPNGDLHLGHLSGPYLGADVFVRFQRLNGNRAWHLTGSDDYQSYVVECARREGRSPAETAAHYSAEIARTLELLDVPLDQYTVTNADPDYREQLQAFFTRLVSSGGVAPVAAPALHDGETGRYLYEVDVTGGCPHCGSGAGGNICEECGEPNLCHDLTNPVARHSSTPPVPGSTTRYQLPLHEYADSLAEHHHLGRVPARLRDLAERLFSRDRVDVPITHPADWGVPPVEDGAPGQVIWVWPEMSYGFLHGIAALGERLGTGWHAHEPQPDWKIVHFFGYDNSFYHSILYPVLYQLAYPDWTPDIDYHVNEFLLLDGAKFSTSRRHAIWGKEILGPDTVDAVRYYLSRIRSEGRRTNFELAAYRQQVRQTLIGGWQHWLNDLGRRVRTTYDGTVPDAGNWTPEHTAFLARLNTRLAALAGALGPDGFSLNAAAAELDAIVTDVHTFASQEARVSQSAGWRAEARTAIALELAAAKLLAVGATAVMPRFAAKLAAALGMEPVQAWPQTVTLVAPGTRIELAEQVFFTDPGADPDTGPDAATAAATEATTDAGPARPADATDGWLTATVASLLETDGPIGDRTLADLGATSLHAVTLQYQILERTGLELSVDELLGGTTVAELALALVRRGAETEAVPA
ncbi:class I tRNA ligase family protein [Plantactinospora sp. KBS50]|uniref:class I tRNA ligase family protein n=1 Tax=Plantactinospora sp. KBS50 TaxID=2024580 RepID=UPI000BAB23F7|nr:class I tRNA ligase family protein [Plantactinospora sp. KBS50]ASW55613.1 methionine--tRNA ligase [Plantactinospora sp. KBS50]